MIVTSYKTNPILKGDDLFDTFHRFLPPLKESEILVVTSKIISICEGNIVKLSREEEKRDLVRKESQKYIDNELTRRYGFQLTIANNICIPNAGIDESNGNGYAVLWPKNPMQRASDIWNYLRRAYSLHHVGVVICDSHTTMLRKGTTGIGLAWCGFQALNNYIGHKDIFKRTLKVTKSHVLDGLAAAAVLVMGEGDEQTPLAVIREAHNVTFSDHPPTQEEILDMRWPIENDMYAPLLMNAPWREGGKA